MIDFYLKLQEKLFSAEAKAKYIDCNVLPPKFIDFYKQQYLSQEGFEVMVMPSVLMEYDIVYNNLEKEPGTINLTFHLCYENARATGSLNKAVQAKSLAFLKFINVTYELLKDLESETVGKLKITSENQNKTDSIIYVHLLTFEGSFTGRNISDKDKYDYTEDDGDLESTSGLVKHYDFGD